MLCAQAWIPVSQEVSGWAHSLPAHSFSSMEGRQLGWGQGGENLELGLLVQLQGDPGVEDAQ